MNLSIIVIAYNEAKIIKKCLESIVQQIKHYSDYEVIIIDNNSNDETKNIIENFIRENNSINLKLLFEPKHGTSYARNRGLNESQKDNVLFIDGDVLLTNNFFETITDDLKTKYSLIGGIYQPWSNVKIPKWFPLDNYSYSFSGRNNLQPIKDHHIAGSVMLFRKSRLQQLNGFPTNMGPKAGTKFFGEDTYIEMLYRKNNYLIGLDPRLLVFHYIPAEKLNFKFIMIDHYQKGRDSKSQTKIIGLLLSIIKNISLILISCISYLFSKNKSMHLKNMINKFSIIAFRLGSFKNK